MCLKKTISDSKKSILNISKLLKNKRKTILTYTEKGCKIRNVSTYIKNALQK